jgi:hypothetical protein
LSFGSSASGAFSSVEGSTFSTASGFGAEADFEFGATATGAFSDADGPLSSAYGFGAQAQGLNSTAVGANSLAVGENDTAVGAGAQVLADQGSSFGAGATVGVGHTNSTAVGAGAATATDNEMMFGTQAQTYTAPGIISGLSKARQTDGPLEVVTSDQSGHLATDGGLIFSELSKLNGGVAVAIAMTNPDLVGSEVFGLSGNVAYWEENVALGFSAMGVLGRKMFGQGERLAVSGALGVSVEEKSFGRQGSNSSVGGRAGAQITW